GSFARRAAATTASSSSSRVEGGAPSSQPLLEVNQKAICQGLICFGSWCKIFAPTAFGWPSRKCNAGYRSIPCDRTGKILRCCFHREAVTLALPALWPALSATCLLVRQATSERKRARSFAVSFSIAIRASDIGSSLRYSSTRELISVSVSF